MHPGSVKSPMHERVKPAQRDVQVCLEWTEMLVPIRRHRNALLSCHESILFQSEVTDATPAQTGLEQYIQKVESSPFLYSKLQYKIGQEFMDFQ